jgi:hypothetical protein
MSAEEVTAMLWQFGPETRIVIGAGAARPVERAAAYLQAQVARRTGWRWAIARGGEAGPGTVALGVPGDGGPDAPLAPEHAEEIALWCGGDPAAPRAFAAAGGPGVALAAAGKLARTFDLRPGLARLPRLARRERPAFPVRGHTLANHKQNTTHDKWDWEQWEDYLTELAAWGSNIAVLYPLHPARWPGVLPFADPPWFDSPERRAEFDRQWAIQVKIPALCRELGLRYGIWLPPNDIFPEEVARDPALTKHGGAYVCPDLPAARARIRAVRDRLFAALPTIDVLFIPSKDDGGCPGCEQCNPWGATYLELVREQAGQVRRHHPHCRIWVTQQGLGAADSQLLLDWLDRERPDWVEAAAFGPFGEAMTFGAPDGAGGGLSLERYARGGPLAGPPGRLRAALPGRYRLVLYPDETHTFRCQYPVLGMDPAVQYVWDRENGPSPRPREMAAIHAATAPAGDGAVPYTEGDTDDVNKFVWSARDWDPSLSGEAIADEYARWFFGPACAEDATALILRLEEILNAPLWGNAAVGECQALLDDCEAREPALLENWRWLNLRLGALMLDWVQRVQRRDREIAAQLRYRVAGWRHAPDPLPTLREAIAFLERRFAETAGLLDEIVWTRDRLFALHRLAVRGVPRLQHSYMQWDRVLAEWRKMPERLDRGELADFPERRAALLGPLQEAEDSARLALQGVELVEHIREFAWERGATRWKWD